MSREKLLSTLNKLERVTKNFSKDGLKQIVKMQNLSLDELQQIERINNLQLNKLKQITNTRRFKSNKNTSKGELLIALLKSNQSHTELQRSEDNNMKIEETKKIFNELRNNLKKKKYRRLE